MPYDAFISYKSDDRPWAARLQRELTARGRSVFFDYASLRAGGPWRPQLERALDESGALIVLWSKAAASQETFTWTEEERFLFSRNEMRSPRERRRPVIFVLLDTSPPTLGALHHVNDIKDAGGYPGSPDKIQASVWDAVTTKICDGMDEGLGIVVVKTLVLSAPLSDFDEGAIGKQRWQRLKNLLVGQGVIGENTEPIEELARRYGVSRRLWRPFATDTITQLLDVLRARLQNDPPPMRLRFESVDTDFDSEDSSALSAAAIKLSRELAFIVVDPLALYVESVGRRVGSLEPCFRSPMNALVVPALRIADDTQLNELLRGTAAAGLATSFFRPAIPPIGNLPSVGLHVRNQEELGRILLLALARNAPILSPSANAILNHE